MSFPETPEARGGARLRALFGADGQRAAQAEQHLRNEWGSWLAEYRWSHFATLTTALPWPQIRLKTAFVNGFIRRVARFAQKPIPWFLAIEVRSASDGERPHVHALLAGAEGVTIEQLRRAWELGNSHVSLYDPSRGAAAYVTKELLASSDSHELSRRWPPRL